MSFHVITFQVHDVLSRVDHVAWTTLIALNRLHCGVICYHRYTTVETFHTSRFEQVMGEVVLDENYITHQ